MATRTQEEIVERIKYLEDSHRDFFGAGRGDLIEFLDFETAQPYLRPDVTEDQWKEVRKELTPEAIKAAVLDYMPFAWEKANNMRGISANRSIDHMKAWVWLTGDDAFLEKLEQIPYEHYGKEQLIAVAEYFGLEWKVWDDGVRTNG